MLEKQFKIWLKDFFSNISLVIVNMHITNLDYLKNKSLCFIKLLNSNIKELNTILIELDIPTVISKTNN